MKRTTCINCGDKLTGIKTKFCGKNCYDILRKKQQQKRYKLFKTPLAKRICIQCAEEYQPVKYHQECCCYNCRIIFNQNNRTYTPAKGGKVKQVKYWQQPFRPKILISGTPIKRSALPISSSSFQDQIKDFLSGGGKIKVLPDQLNGRTPSVGGINAIKVSKREQGYNVDVSGHWDASTMLGFGYEIDVMDDGNDQY